MIPYAEDFFLNILHYKAFLLSKKYAHEGKYCTWPGKLCLVLKISICIGHKVENTLISH